VTLRLCIRTVGCRTNQADSLALELAGAAGGAQVVGEMEDADVVIINSCAVTSRAARDVRRLVGQARRRAPRARLIVTGCMVEVEEPDLWTSLGVSRVVPGAEKMSVLDGLLGGPPLERALSSFRPALKVQEGCSIGCRYCIVPRTRGPERSVDPDEVERAAASLAGRGAREVVLTGTQLGAWGRDLEPPRTLAQLVRRLLAGRTVRRVRLSSIEPWGLDPALTAMLASERPGFCHHLHVPLQSGSARIHRAMGRPGDPDAWYATLCRAAALAPDVALGTDVLVGFPGEEPVDFADTEALLRSVPLSYLHVFPFSPRPGTPASDMPGRPDERDVQERVKSLRALSTGMRVAFLGRLLGYELEVVVERARRSGRARGRGGEGAALGARRRGHQRRVRPRGRRGWPARARGPDRCRPRRTRRGREGRRAPCRRDRMIDAPGFDARGASVDDGPMCASDAGGVFALLFDMDGVLVDVSRSFRRVIRDVVEALGGGEVTSAHIQSLKQEGGFNDDIRLSEELLRRRGAEVEHGRVRGLFDELYQGSTDRPGAWREETWLLPADALARLSRGRRLGVVTGRTREEVEIARGLDGQALDAFECVITQDELPPGRGKPMPDGILAAMQALGASRGTYVGDAVDDMKAARAAGLRAIGVIPPGAGAGRRLEDLMLEAGADTVLGSIRELEDRL